MLLLQANIYTFSRYHLYSQDIKYKIAIMNKITFCLCILLGLFINLALSQDPPVLATLEVGSDTEVIGTVGNSIIFRDNRSIYSSDGTVAGTTVIGNLDENEKVLHSRIAYRDKFYFVIGGDEIDVDDVKHSLVEVDPKLGLMNVLLNNKKRISGLITYNDNLFLGLTEDLNFGNAYLRFNPETSELIHIFDISERGIEDAINHDGFIYLVLRSITNAGTYLAKSNGQPGSLEEFYSLREEDYPVSPNRINFTSAGSKLYFWHLTDSNYTLFVTEGANGNTKALISGLKFNHKFEYSNYKYRDILALNDELLFCGSTTGGIPQQLRLWVSDGTTTKELFIEGEGIVSPSYSQS